jgi:hypothetical protein
VAGSLSVPRIADHPNIIPPAFFNACFVLAVINATLFPVAYFSHLWIYDSNGQGIPTDFVNVWAAGRMVLDGHPALAWDWDLQKQVELDLLKQDFIGYFAWHYPPPFLFVATLLASLPYSVAFVGWLSVSILPYLAVMRAIVGSSFGFVFAVAFPMVVNNALAGQNGFLTAALIGATLYLMPLRPVLSGVCLGLLAYKPQYGLLFPLVLIATSQWRVFFSAAVTSAALVFVSWLAFGTESWLAFFHWMPMFSKAFLVEGKATWWKLQSTLSMVRYFGGSEMLAWTCQWIVSGAVAIGLVLMWRSQQVRYPLKAAALAIGTVLTTPYLFMYDMVVLAIAVAYLLRLGMAGGFMPYELAALVCALGLFVVFTFTGIPTGLAATLIIAALVLRRAGPWWQRQPALVMTPA